MQASRINGIRAFGPLAGHSATHPLSCEGHLTPRICLYGAFRSQVTFFNAAFVSFKGSSGCRPWISRRSSGGLSGTQTNRGEPANWARSIAPHPCIRLDRRAIRTMKQSFASAARLRGGGPFSSRHRSHADTRVIATSDRYRRPVATARAGAETVGFRFSSTGPIRLSAAAPRPPEPRRS